MNNLRPLQPSLRNETQNINENQTPQKPTFLENDPSTSNDRANNHRINTKSIKLTGTHHFPSNRLTNLQPNNRTAPAISLPYGTSPHPKLPLHGNEKARKTEGRRPRHSLGNGTETPNGPGGLNGSQRSKRSHQTNIRTIEETKFIYPQPFIGNPNDLRNFLRSVTLYLEINQHIYDNDEKKTVLLFSLLKEEAAVWKKQFLRQPLSDETLVVEQYHYLIENLRKDFECADTEIDDPDELDNLDLESHTTQLKISLGSHPERIRSR